MKKILITGGAGFIGSHLAEKFLKNGYEVTVIDNLSTGDLNNLKSAKSNPKLKIIIEDIRNEQVIDRIVSENDYIFHLAAVVGVFNIINSPVSTIETNINGTEIILKTAKRYMTPVLIASTSEVYGKTTTQKPFKENDDIIRGPTTKSRWSYAATKELDEFLGLAYFEEFNLPITIVRLFNTVGPRQKGHYGMVLPRFIEWALNNENIQVYGDGSQSRCFANVLDVVDALYLLFKSKKSIGEVFNIGNTQEITIEDLAKKVIKITKSKAKIEKIPYDKIYKLGFEDMQKRIPDVSKIQSTINWKPKINLDSTIQSIINEKTSI